MALVCHAPKEMSHMLVPLENSYSLLLNGFGVQYVFERKKKKGTWNLINALKILAM